jgi:hypothetical protein
MIEEQRKYLQHIKQCYINLFRTCVRLMADNHAMKIMLDANEKSRILPGWEKRLEAVRQMDHYQAYLKQGEEVVHLIEQMSLADQAMIDLLSQTPLPDFSN